jgi:hypothetical protein
MSYFTKNYRLVTTVSCVPFPVSVQIDNSSRWICKCYKEALGNRGFLITLVDNELEMYSFLWAGPGTTNFSDPSKVVISCNREGVPVAVTCMSQQEALPMPDFAIDVMETVQINTLYEVIRRITVAFHEKLATIRA